MSERACWYEKSGHDVSDRNRLHWVGILISTYRAQAPLKRKLSKSARGRLRRRQGKAENGNRE